MAMEPDQLYSTHPLHVPVSDPTDIAQIFDRITYDKVIAIPAKGYCNYSMFEFQGASVLRMLKYVLGEKVFQQGVIDYLTAYMYKNAMRTDLWKFYTDVSGCKIYICFCCTCNLPQTPLIEGFETGKRID